MRYDSQAVAFNMFLAFFAVLLTVLSLTKSSLEGEGGHDLAVPVVSGCFCGTFKGAMMILRGHHVRHQKRHSGDDDFPAQSR
jgi:hypothetical protein